ncbi:hypothetical protein RI129_009957 [Pyrocoelia pectoralis]|uniref:Uncharacterized protein n=1 Tax=Pyrocoelia pectoralis TaxID=417401 RepID=A0AAN7V3G7_9COLE
MNVCVKLFKYIHLCLFIEKGSWSPQNVNRNRVNRRHREILNRKLRDRKHKNSKPEWLKQWTISKGWMHNRSHLLELGVSTENLIVTPAVMSKDDDSSVSIDNIDDLLSIASEKFSDDDLNKIEILNGDIDEYSQAFDNYRKTFPDVYCQTNSNGDIKLPEIYKERLLLNDGGNCFKEFWAEFKVKKRKNCRKNTKNITFTINELYGTENKLPKVSETVNKPKVKVSKSTLGEDLATYNALNSKTNLHEDTIYECSEDNVSLYNNPIYVSSDAFERNRRYFDFHTNRASNRFLKTNCGKSEVCIAKKCDSVNRVLKTEKYIIRHIKIRIMLSLRVNRLRRLYRRSRRGNAKRSKTRFNTVKSKIKSAHEEQRRIGNGKNSLKIQNMRYC